MLAATRTADTNTHDEFWQRGCGLSDCVEFFLPNLIAYFWYYCSPSVQHVLLCIMILWREVCFTLRLFKCYYSTQQLFFFYCSSPRVVLNIDLLCLFNEGWSFIRKKLLFWQKEMWTDCSLQYLASVRWCQTMVFVSVISSIQNHIQFGCNNFGITLW